MNTMYLISTGAQSREVEDRCYGTCRKVKVGHVTFLGGSFAACSCAECPYQQDTMDMGERVLCGDTFDVVMRRLS